MLVGRAASGTAALSIGEAVEWPRAAAPGSGAASGSVSNAGGPLDAGVTALVMALVMALITALIAALVAALVAALGAARRFVADGVASTNTARGGGAAID